MKNVYLKNSLVVGIIFLFVGVGIQPAFASESIKSDNYELEKVTIQFYETDRTYNHTVLLTKEQVKELENLIDDFEIKLDNADNKIETEAIYKDTIVSLNDYGILPEDMSIEKAQRLVTGKEHNPVVVKLFEKWYNRNQKSIGGNTNFLCLVDGYLYAKSEFFSPVQILLRPLRNFYTLFFSYLGKFVPALAYEFFLKIPYYFLWNILYIIPFGIGYEFTCGYKYVKLDGTTHYSSCQTDFDTFGLNGKKNFYGKKFGQLPLLPAILADITYSGNLNGLFYTYPAIFGFTGLKYPQTLPNQEMVDTLIGFALWVKLGEEHP